MSIPFQLIARRQCRGSFGIGCPATCSAIIVFVSGQPIQCFQLKEPRLFGWPADLAMPFEALHEYITVDNQCCATNLVLLAPHCLQLQLGYQLRSVHSLRTFNCQVQLLGISQSTHLKLFGSQLHTPICVQVVVQRLLAA